MALYQVAPGQRIFAEDLNQIVKLLTGVTLLDSNTEILLVAANNAINTLKVRVSGNSSNRFMIRSDGALFWGSGSAAEDTNLYRASANTLKTDDNMVVGGSLTIGGSASIGADLTVLSNLSLSGHLQRGGNNVIRFSTDNTIYNTHSTNGLLILNYDRGMGVRICGSPSRYDLFVHNSGGVSIGTSTDPGGTNLLVNGRTTATAFTMDAQNRGLILQVEGTDVVSRMVNDVIKVPFIINSNAQTIINDLVVGSDRLRAHRHPYSNNRHVESLRVGVGTAGAGTHNWTFTNPYSATPTVVATIQGPNGVTINVNSISTTGASISWGFNSGGASLVINALAEGQD